MRKNLKIIIAKYIVFGFIDNYLEPRGEPRPTIVYTYFHFHLHFQEEDNIR